MINKDKPTLSIITPTYNCSKTIEKCILSVKEISKYNNIEYIIVDGGSSDGTIDIINKYSNIFNIKLISEKDNGLYDAINKGSELVSGQYMCWLDGDNYYKTRVFNEITNILKSKEPDILCGYINIVNEKKILKTHKPPFPFTYKKALKYTTGAIPVQPAVFFKKSIFKKIGGFDVEYKIASDYDLWIKILKLNPDIIYLEKVIGYYRKENTGVSQSLIGLIDGYKEIYNITKREGQSFYGRVITSLKYIKGYISAYIKILFKK